MGQSTLFIRAWRLFRGLSLEELAAKSALSVSTVESMETGESTVVLSDMEAMAGGLGIPPAWLFIDPKELDLLFNDEDEHGELLQSACRQQPDPIYAKILVNMRQNRQLYTLLTALLESGEAKLIRAAELSIKSLLKQSRQSALPWQSRVPGNFEPPSD
jgi:transcriptional regulator with XRE-family HTH domain